MEIDAIGKSIEEIEKLKSQMYSLCVEELDSIVQNNIQDEKRIDKLFDHLLDFYYDGKFMDLFWKLIKYVESYDRGLGAQYRRIEELLNEGN